MGLTGWSDAISTHIMNLLLFSMGDKSWKSVSSPVSLNVANNTSSFTNMYTVRTMFVCVCMGGAIIWFINHPSPEDSRQCTTYVHTTVKANSQQWNKLRMQYIQSKLSYGQMQLVHIGGLSSCLEHRPSTGAGTSLYPPVLPTWDDRW